MNSSASAPWSRDDTQTYLSANPLPRDFTWPHRDGGDRPVHPAHTSVNSYGAWLRETPYFRGLFPLIHEILATAPDLGDAAWLAGELRAHRARSGASLFES